MQQIMAQLVDILHGQKRVAIFSHNNPDGDTLGSQLALAAALEEFGTETILINNDVISEKYHFMAGSDRIQPYKDGMDLPEVLIFVDCATLELAGYDESTAFLQGKTILNIDHHASNRNYGTVNYVRSEMAANCQNIYEIIKELGQTITADIATALYVGLSTDTGNFLFDNVTSKTLRIAADLKDLGADTNTLRLNMYESCSHKRMELMKDILNGLHISENGLYAWSELSYERMQEINPASTDIDGLINHIKDIEGVEVAALFRGVKEDRTKVSLRSKVWSDVNHMANEFGGGGHKRAAGCTIQASTRDAAKQMEPVVMKFLETEQQ